MLISKILTKLTSKAPALPPRHRTENEGCAKDWLLMKNSLLSLISDASHSPVVLTNPPASQEYTNDDGNHNVAPNKPHRLRHQVALQETRLCAREICEHFFLDAAAAMVTVVSRQKILIREREGGRHKLVTLMREGQTISRRYCCMQINSTIDCWSLLEVVFNMNWDKKMGNCADVSMQRENRDISDLTGNLFLDQDWLSVERVGEIRALLCV